LNLRLSYEGRFKWIVFLPTRAFPETPDAAAVGALNRYYGCLDKAPSKPSRSQAGQPLDYIAGGAMKVRGIELRQHSAPGVVRRAQEAFLGVVAKADGAAGFRALLPAALDAAGDVLRRVERGEAALDELVVTNSVGKTAEEYRVTTCAAAAVRQLKREGVSVEPGQVVRYVITDVKSRDPARKVREARLIRGDEKYDAAAYAKLVVRSIASMVLPFSLDEERLAERYARTHQTRLSAVEL
jgi:DNA polymerase elongation subunit (family B)